MRVQKFNRVPVKTLAAMLVAGVASFCAAQEYDSGPTQRPVMTVTAGQGGYIRLPDLRPAEQTYALTGQRDTAAANRTWQREAGPLFRAGNATIILPQSR